MNAVGPRRGQWLGVVDIGSNSVRLVTYPARHRVPRPVVNEKVSARLGRTLEEDGLIPEKAGRTALQGLARFAAILRLLKIDDPIVVATAAVRDARNGPEFITEVAKLGLEASVLTGAEEAAASAAGVRCAFPDAAGMVADLGGGSLELVQLDRDDGITLPLGTLRLQRMREKGSLRANRIIAKHVPQDAGMGKPLFVVGGSWRALAQFAMLETGSPLSWPHGYTMGPDLPDHLVRVLSHLPERSLHKLPGITQARIATLADAALVLAALSRRTRPSMIVTSAFGLREGLAYQRLPQSIRDLDPLYCDLEQQLAGAVEGTIYGPSLFKWVSPLFADRDRPFLAAMEASCWLASRLRDVDRSQRTDWAVEQGLHAHLVGITAFQRALVASALIGLTGAAELPTVLNQLADSHALDDANQFGAAMRFAAKLSAGEPAVLDEARLQRADHALHLSLNGIATLFSEQVEQHLAILSERLGLSPRVE